MAIKFRKDRKILCVSEKVQFVCLVFVTVFTTIGLVLLYTQAPIIVEKQLKKSLELKKGTIQYERFLKIPFPLEFKVYVFHVENSNDIVQHGAQPKLVERGPYIYKLFRERIVLNENDAEDTITVKIQNRLQFDARKSYPLSDHDVLTTINIPMMVTYHRVSDKITLINALVSNCREEIFQQTDLFVNVTVKDVLIDGMKVCNKAVPSKNPLCTFVKSVVCEILFHNPFIRVDPLNNSTLQFSYYNYFSTLNDRNVSINRGMNNISRLGEMIRVNDLRYLQTWGYSQNTCNKVTGATELIIAPSTKTDSKLTIYSLDVCLTMDFSYVGQKTYANIKAYTFESRNTTFRPKHLKDDCLCNVLSTSINDTKYCYLNGILSIHSCLDVAILISHPHYLWTDQSMLNSVQGLHPDPALHKSFITIEPDTGTPLEAAKRAQINIALRPIPGIKQTKNLTRVILPIFWIDEGINLPSEFIRELKFKYFLPILVLDIVKWSLWTLLCAGVILFAIVLYRHYKSITVNENIN